MRPASVIWFLTISIGCTLNGGATDAGVPTPPLVDSGMIVSDSGSACGVDCPPEQCRDQICFQAPNSECGSEQPCPEGQRCSVAGLCFEGACQTHGDCPANQRCHASRCLARIESPAGIQFERVYIPALGEHQSVPNLETEEYVSTGGTGFGLTLLDIDGDLDLDLFVGSEGGSPACLYRNESRPTQLRFSAIDIHCNDPPGQWHGGMGIDLEGDGYHELIKLGPARIEVQRFHPEPSTQHLIEELPVDDIRRQCSGGSAIAQDFDYDGRIDLLIGCHLDLANGARDSFKNLLFLQDKQGLLRFVDRDEWVTGDAVLHDLESSTLALGAADLNDDGLNDLIVNEDVLVEYVLNEPDPGGVYYACAPDEDCRFVVQRFASGRQAEGGFMGSAVLRVGDHPSHHIYITDIGDNRLLRGTDSGFRNVAEAANATIGFLGGEGVFGWGVIVDDFDFDGDDDLFVANGGVPTHSIADFAMHLDLLLLQKEPGRFDWFSSDVGIDPFTIQDSGHDERPFASRAALKADLDRDQMMDILTAGMEGRPRFHREIPILGSEKKRCTLVPIPLYVPGFGSGHRIVLPHDTRPRLWDSQGQVRSGASPFILSPSLVGTLIFPSGAQVTFDCRQTHGLTVLLEPEWLQLSRDGDRLRIGVGSEAPEGSLSVLIEGQTLVQAIEDQPGSWTIDAPQPGARIMLKFGGRWTARWWTIP